MDQRTVSISSPYVVGLTGGIGSGKSAAAELFAARGASLVDADVIAREVVLPGTSGLAAIVEAFGTGILLSDGTLNRAALRSEVFNDKSKREWLNALLHPLIRAEMQAALQRASGPYVLLVVPLLVENQLTALCHRVLVVDCSPETQLQRASQRDKVAPDIVKHMMAAQASRGQRLAAANDIIHNDGSLDELEAQVEQLHQLYLTVSAELRR